MNWDIAIPAGIVCMAVGVTIAAFTVTFATLEILKAVSALEQMAREARDVRARAREKYRFGRVKPAEFRHMHPRGSSTIDHRQQERAW